MLTKKQIQEIREHLENSKNPVFFYDSDADGLASFVLLAKWIGREKGIVAKSFDENWKIYLKKIKEFGSDYVFILDKPQINKDFIDGVKEMSLPLVAIDHHELAKPDIKFYYNTFDVSRKTEPVSYICYEITKQKKDMWVSVVGCIGDCFIPKFLKEFQKQNPDLINCKYKNAFDIYYKCKIGELVKIFNYGLKDTTTNVVRMTNFLINANFPSEIMEENNHTKSFLEKYRQIENILDKLFLKAKEKIHKNILFFVYSGEMSLSQHLADRLVYEYPKKVIVVGYKNENKAKIKFSLRGKIDIREVVLEAIKKFQDATGGGHKNSAGLQISSKDIEKLKKFLEEKINGN